MKNWAYKAGAIYGFLGVALGAFGAHALEDLLTANERVDTWDTATHYHLIHAVFLIVIGLVWEKRNTKWIRTAAIAATLGIFVFSGSLYLLALTNMTWLGAITPLGGLGFLLAWASLFFHQITSNKTDK